MYVIVKTGGKQYKAAKDDVLVVDKLEGEAGDKITLSEVLMVSKESDIKLGSPYVKGASVDATIIRQSKGKKLDCFNYKPKKNIRKRWGHRQPQTHIRITGVSGGN